MPRIQVRGGTRSTTQKTLCESCVRGQVTLGMSESQKHVWCHQMEHPILFNVEVCSHYCAWGTPSLHDMKELATIIDVTKVGVGFYSPAAWRAKKGEGRTLPPEYGDEDY